MSDICCQSFDPKEWDKKNFKWKKKRFVKSKAFCFLGNPIGYKKAVVEILKKVRAVSANVPNLMCLSEDIKKWNMDILMAVDRDIPDSLMVELSGEFVSRVYEGELKKKKIWDSDFQEYVSSKKVKIDKIFRWFVTCGKCSRRFKKNYVVYIAGLK